MRKIGFEASKNMITFRAKKQILGNSVFSKSPIRPIPRYAVKGEEIPRGSKINDHIIIGTPGKVLDWALKFRFFDVKKIRVFVLDEADVMIATQGHQVRFLTGAWKCESNYHQRRIH